MHFMYIYIKGTVPYWSLQQSQEWAKKSIEENSNDKIEIKEIDGAEHRAILSDERFHKILLNFLTWTTTGNKSDDSELME
jgi:hypothetical protein